MNKLFILVLAGLCSQGFCMNFDPHSSPDNLYKERRHVSDIIAHFGDTLDNWGKEIANIVSSNRSCRNYAILEQICKEWLAAIAFTRDRISFYQDENTKLICILNFLYDSKGRYDALGKLFSKL